MDTFGLHLLEKTVAKVTRVTNLPSLPAKGLFLTENVMEIVVSNVDKGQRIDAGDVTDVSPILISECPPPNDLATTQTDLWRPCPRKASA
jgi:hypothetical protein